jgi:hypothetical protein
MDFRKLSANGDSTSVTLPKEELEELGVVDDDGELVEDVWARVTHDGDGQFSVSVVGAAE